MSALTAYLDELAGQLAGAGLTNVTTFEPEFVSPPALILSPGTPYLERTDYGTWLIRVRARMVVPDTDAQAAQDALNAATVATIAAVDAAGTALPTQVGTRYLLDIAGQLFYAADLTLTDEITITP